MRRRTTNRRSCHCAPIRPTSAQPPPQYPLFTPPPGPPAASISQAPQVFIRLAPATPSPAFSYYWHFAAERQNIFYRRFLGLPTPWTADPVLQTYKFTNAYRASDRVSQYLLSSVIGDTAQSFEDVFLKTILFKLFNRVETWEYLLNHFGEISSRTFSLDRYVAALSRRLSEGTPIYSAAYMMPPGHHKHKHHSHLQLLHLMMEEHLPARLLRAKRMSEGFDLLISYPMIGPFLAYQYITDLNYGPWLTFNESEFVVPGPGALDGIAKCFDSLGDLAPADVIRFVADIQEASFAALELPFLTLWGRPLQFIDCQNLFCEVDKYLRVVSPSLRGRSGRTRIKHTFRPARAKLSYRYPSKWAVNHLVQLTSGAKSLTEVSTIIGPGRWR